MDVPVVNPIIIPKDTVTPLEAPAGNNFIGIVNPQNNDLNGKLVHTAVAGAFAQETRVEVTVFANRGRLAGASMPVFDTQPSDVLVTLFGWDAGHVPTVNPNTDNWSRAPSVKLQQPFTNWTQNGEWASQTFEFVTDKDLAYLSLAIAGMNHKNASYVAFDIE
jgi:hypothetical protein